MDYQRYAIYYAPPADSALHELGSAWLGWDTIAGHEVPHPDIPGLPAPVSSLSETPRKYGLHGTLKPPFRLMGGTVDDLVAVIEQDICDQPAFELPLLQATALGRFLALTPSAPSEPLAALAAACVQAPDRFRAPQTEAELEKRRASGLTETQEQNLQRWGYPYVLDEFRFHITLTGKLDPSIVQPVQAALQSHLAPAVSEPVWVKDVCLFGEAPDGRFHQINRFALRTP